MSTAPVGFFQTLLQNWLWDPGPGQRQAIPKGQNHGPQPTPTMPITPAPVSSRGQIQPWCPTPWGSHCPPPGQLWLGRGGATHTAGAVGLNQGSGLQVIPSTPKGPKENCAADVTRPAAGSGLGLRIRLEALPAPQCPSALTPRPSTGLHRSLEQGHLSLPCMGPRRPTGEAGVL